MQQGPCPRELARKNGQAKRDQDESGSGEDEQGDPHDDEDGSGGRGEQPAHRVGQTSPGVPRCHGHHARIPARWPWFGPSSVRWDTMTPRTYLDHAATTPMLPAARERWLAVSEAVGNPSSLHASGRAARRVVEEARESIAADLEARPSAVVFTGGGTESDNLAIKGLYWARAQHRRGLAASRIEHHAVLDPVQWLEEHDGAVISWLPVDAEGRVDLAALDVALAGDSVGVASVMWANNEIGTVQPIEEIAERCRERGVWMHSDAVQALGQVPVSFSGSGVHALTVTAHKIGGPVGIGTLVIEPALTPTPLLHGGGQERSIRSGTLDAPGAAAFAVAVHAAVTGQAAHARDIAALRDRLVQGVLGVVPDAVLNGADGQGRLAGNAHFTFPGCEGDALLMLLDAAGIDCSTGSACSAGVPEPSHVLLALGVDARTARCSLRFSLGRTSTQEDVDHLIAVLPGVVDRARRAGGGRG